MAKCIVCSKSAGPFNSLHKSCLSIYQDTERCLQEKISSCSSEYKSFSEQLEGIQACKLSGAAKIIAIDIKDGGIV